MFIAKSRIENFDDCRVGDILYEDPDDDSHDWKLYTKQNRITAKLKSRPILPGALVASIEKKGLKIQTINVHNDDFASYTTVATGGALSGTLIPPQTSSGVINWPTSTTSSSSQIIGRLSGGGGTSAKVKPTPPKSKTISTPIPMSKFIEKSLGKLIRKIR